MPASGPPCDGCRHAARCKAANLACEAFALFKRFGTSPERWAYAPRQPNAEIFARPNTGIGAASPVCRCTAELEEYGGP
jgi:hypothetical protein